MPMQVPEPIAGENPSCRDVSADHLKRGRLMNPRQKKEIVLLLSIWAEWLVKLQTRNPLWFPSQSTEGRLMVDGGRVDGKPPGSIVPLMQMPPDIARVHLATKQLNPEGLAVLRWHHIEPGSVTANAAIFAKANGFSVQTYWYRLNQAHKRIGVALGVIKISKVA